MDENSVRIVPFSEIGCCLAHRLDPEHYMPIHRTWECRHGTKLRTKGTLVRAWLDGEITTAEFQLAMKYVK
jgi:hypothetical protein